MFILRDGSQVVDSRLGRLKQFDARSRQHGIFDTPSLDGGIDLRLRPIISRRWVKTFGQEHLDQGQLGACVGMGMTAALEHEPGIISLGSDFAKRLYFSIQQNDEYPGGEYPGADPVAGGTSLLAALQYMKAAGLIKGYVWAFTLEQVLIGIGYYGVAIFGLSWTRDMLFPASDGFCRPTGRDMGGHCTAGTCVNIYDKTISGPNSWGDGWNPALQGDWKMTWSDIADRLHAGGECAFIRK